MKIFINEEKIHYKGLNKKNKKNNENEIINLIEEENNKKNRNANCILNEKLVDKKLRNSIHKKSLRKINKENYNENNTNKDNEIEENNEKEISTSLDFEEKSELDDSSLNVKRTRNGKFIKNEQLDNKIAKYYLLKYNKVGTSEELLEKIKNIRFERQRKIERKIFNLIIVEKENKYIAFVNYEIKFHYSDTSFDIGKYQYKAEGNKFGYTQIIGQIIE